jgi:hypothetical protein
MISLARSRVSVIMRRLRVDWQDKQRAKRVSMRQQAEQCEQHHHAAGSPPTSSWRGTAYAKLEPVSGQVGLRFPGKVISGRRDRTATTSVEAECEKIQRPS